VTEDKKAGSATPGFFDGPAGETPMSTGEPGTDDDRSLVVVSDEVLMPAPRARTIIIESVRRVPVDGEAEELLLEPGVNLIVGPPNAGKSKWLSFIDFVLGDTDPPEETLGPELAEKYCSASVAVRVFGAEPSTDSALSHRVPVALSGSGLAEEEASTASDADAGRVFCIERRWRETGLKGKVLVDGEAMTAEEFSSFLLSTLGIPLVHYPKGNPYAPRAWPSLSWRTLFRHVYRQDRFWSDLADRQPESEQHAALMQFLGLASRLFSNEYGDLVAKRREAERLRVLKDSYMALLLQITRELGRYEEFSVSITPESLTTAKARLTAERDAIARSRSGLLASLSARVASGSTGQAPETGAAVSEYGARLSTARATREALQEDLSRSLQRLEELQLYRRSVHQERERLDRAEGAAGVLSQLRVTNCPACDQPIEHARVDGDTCYVCQRAQGAPEGEETLGLRRLAFERDQLAIEEAELAEVIAQAERDVGRIRAELGVVGNEIQTLDDLLRPTRVAAAAVLPPELSILDQQAGALDEQLRTLTSIEKSLHQRDALTAEIDRITAEADTLESEVAALRRDVPLEASATLLEDGFNSYFNALMVEDPARWPEGDVSVRLRKEDFRIQIKDADWQLKLGRTLVCFFLNAYHYALVSLSDKVGCNYPGLAIIDFPPTLADERELTDEENYLIEPFIGLAARLLPRATTQIIVAGRAFVDLQGANRIALTTVYQ